MDAITREKLKTYTRKNEGTKYKPYKDSKNIWTWGVGHNLESNPFTLAQTIFILNNPIPDAIEYVFDCDIEQVLILMAKNYIWMHELTAARQVACADLLFNMGYNVFSGFKLMLDALKFENYTKAASELKGSLYANQVGLRAINNAKMIETGEF